MHAPRSATHARTHACLLGALLLGACWEDPIQVGDRGCADAGPCGCEPLDTDADGVCDALDRCEGPGSSDADRDGVCDEHDLCAGADERTDSDADGTPDCADECDYDGSTPPALWALPAEIMWLTVRSIDIGGAGRVASALCGEEVPVTIGYEVRDCECPGCMWAIRAGWVGEPLPQTCLLLDVAGCPGISRTDTTWLRVPDQPGEHGVRFDGTRNIVCDTGGWDVGTRRIDELGVVCAR